MKKYHANPSVNRTENLSYVLHFYVEKSVVALGAATAASVISKCYSFKIIMYYFRGPLGV